MSSSRLKITPFIADQDIVCAETIAPPTAMVVFGASGDLVSRKLLPGLMQIFQRQLLDDKFYLLGIPLPIVKTKNRFF